MAGGAGLDLFEDQGSVLSACLVGEFVAAFFCTGDDGGVFGGSHVDGECHVWFPVERFIEYLRGVAFGLLLGAVGCDEQPDTDCPEGHEAD